MKKIFSAFLLLLMLCPSWAWAQLQRSEAFKQQYRLTEVVVLSRHNIRSPLSTNGSALGRLTPHQWTQWSSAASELTQRGGVLETMMGQYFRKWLVSEGLHRHGTVFLFRLHATGQYPCEPPFLGQHHGSYLLS